MAAAESAWRFSDLAGEGNKQAAVLNSGASMPLVGLGTWKAKPGEVGAAVKAALAAGYRHIDCAAVYGNEKEVGEVFKSVFRAADGSDELRIPREEVFITSKLWNSEHGAGLPLPALKNTLQVGVCYIFREVASERVGGKRLCCESPSLTVPLNLVGPRSRLP